MTVGDDCLRQGVYDDRHSLFTLRTETSAPDPAMRHKRDEQDNKESGMNMDDKEERTVSDKETQNCHSAVQILSYDDDRARRVSDVESN